MTSQLILQLFERDLKKINEELMLYKKEEDIWKTEKGITNSAGTLCLHLIGNLNHFIGTALGNTGFVREREKEFSERNVSREKMMNEFDKAGKIISTTLSKLSDADLEKDFPIDFGGTKKTIHVLMILVAHFNYHLGQINYHRRLVEG